jgi:tripartite-type tricarboxylate transporter receptor subunit TctC
MRTATVLWKRIGRVPGKIALPAIAAVGLVVMAANAASSQAYPSKLIKLIVPLASGSPPDAMARLTAKVLSERLGQPVIVENRPGGGGTIGTKAVGTSAPDGYTLLFGGANHTLGPAIFKNLDYDPVKDFSPIATVGAGYWVLVVPSSLPARSVKELVDYAKANPGKLNWGYGVNAGPHLLGELFLHATGIDVARISYKGGVQAMPDMLGGRIQLNFTTTTLVLPLIQEGKLRALAVTSEARHPALPDVPTMIESGLPGLTRGFWGGLLAPALTTPDIVKMLNSEVNASLATPEMKANLLKLGFEPKTGLPQDFASLLTNEIAAWKAAAKLARIVPE